MSCGSSHSPLTTPLAAVLTQKCASVFACLWLFLHSEVCAVGTLLSVVTVFIYAFVTLLFQAGYSLIPLPIYYVLYEVVFIGIHRWHLALIWHSSS